MHKRIREDERLPRESGRRKKKVQNSMRRKTGTGIRSFTLSLSLSCIPLTK